MKRGLKVGNSSCIDLDCTGYNRFPDEKGTERLKQVISPTKKFSSQVTIVSPMKRGLKANRGNQRRGRSEVTIVSPMKRGLKEWEIPELQRMAHCYNRFPDEKGTESDSVMTLPLRLHKLQSFPR